uniref:H/ACA ribonucleoprotein complex subunit n=1 Tax=Gorilla gorilla gorilla TaxID=9595 RepID=A0A2I2YQI2_GORGO
MSFPGGGRGGFDRGGGGGGFNRGSSSSGGGGNIRGGDRGGFGRGGGHGGFTKGQGQGPPECVVLLGEFLHPCEGDIVCKRTADENKVSYFYAPVYLENKEQIGKADEIFGQLRDFYFSANMSENGKKFYIDPYELLPLQRFLPRPPGEKGPPRRGGRGGRGGRRGGGRGGGFRGGRGGGGFRGRGR